MNDIDAILNEAAACLGSSTPELGGAELSEFINGFLERRDVFLKISREHGSPVYVMDDGMIKKRAVQFVSAFRERIPGVDIYYAMKSNNHPHMSKMMVSAGLGLDVSSGLELESALSVGAERIVFSGPGKSNREMMLALGHRDRVTVLIDSFNELENLEKAAAQVKASIRAGVRVTTGAHGIWRKFGIPLTDLSHFIELAEKCRHVKFCGIQSHVSWNMDPCRQVEFIKTLSAALKTLPAGKLAMIEFIDLGGGFWPEQGEWLQEAGTLEGGILRAVRPEGSPSSRHFKRQAVGIGVFASAIGDAVRDHIFPLVKCRICLEPGRWLCNDGMHILVTVADKKAEDLVITDAGTNAIGWDRFETDYAPLINLTRPSTAEHRCLVMGSLCTPHDLWGYSYHGTGIENGDVLLVPCQGAYTYSLRQNFIKPLPDVVVIDK